ncbi:hypothetical protein yc1106_00352 [Curvularia clavata]|uniref:DUF6594 domain-containing protein n=1 Tax=Curvularia clavata TaxID=95742 RepID=A0A9Q8Z2C3_CURCL|nr:hypothetical protein yc1106_00352 [Curvularia clavata]
MPQNIDLEPGDLRNRDGYPTLARWIARDPDGETFVFRKFDQLAARYALHLQARITSLEAEIEGQDRIARNHAEYEVRQGSKSWEMLSERAKAVDSFEEKRVNSIEEMGELVQKYYDFLNARSQIAEKRQPCDRSMSALREFVNGTAVKNDEGVPVSLIKGRAQGYLDHKSDLITLARPIEEDYLSRFLQDHWIFRSRNTSEIYDRTTVYKNLHITRTVAGIDLLLAAILLIGAIANLYLVPNAKAKLGLVAMYTILFASSVALCTNARRTEIFAATAAYAAVLVVFVSGDLGGTQSQQCLIQLEGAIWKTVACPG